MTNSVLCRMHPNLRKLLNWSVSNENLLNRLVANLRKVRKPDKMIHVAHNQAFSEIECLDCGNCCRNLGPLLLSADIKRAANALKISEGNFTEKYLKIDEDGDFVFKSMPCPFLDEDNFCAIYDVRPKACREFPHTNENGQIDIIHLTRKNAKICPAVSRIFQILQKEFKDQS